MPQDTAEPGLRERKKQRTRQSIADTARELFVERGFDGVTVAEIARVADVAEKTVFNYFPTKEDLVYWRLEEFEGELLKAIRKREPGASALSAFSGFVLEQRGWLAAKDPETRKRLTDVTRMITESPALMAREHEIFDRFTASLAALLADETGADRGDVRSWVVANALMGVHRAMLDYTRRGVNSGVSPPRLARQVQAQGEQALAALEAGLADYAVEGP